MSASLPRHGLLAGLAASVALLLMTGCGSGPGAAPAARAASTTTVATATPVSTATATPVSTVSPAGPAGHATPGSTVSVATGQRCAPGKIGPVGASFVSADDGYLLGIALKDCWADAASTLRLRKTTDGGLRWTSLTAPSAPWGAIAPSGPGRVPADGVTSLLFADARDGWHPAATHLYASADAGRHWTKIATLGMYDGAGTVERTGAGTLLVAGLYNGVALSRDGGRTWTWPSAIDKSENVGGGGALEADLFTSNDGYVIDAGNSLWITRDAGRTWQPVTVR